MIKLSISSINVFVGFLLCGIFIYHLYLIKTFVPLSTHNLNTSSILNKLFNKNNHVIYYNEFMVLSWQVWTGIHSNSLASRVVCCYMSVIYS